MSAASTGTVGRPTRTFPNSLGVDDLYDRYFDAVVTMWQAPRGMNTADIARSLRIPEGTVEHLVFAWLECKRKGLTDE